jgi:tetratricopeptide (TPR) repeat protein
MGKTWIAIVILFIAFSVNGQSHTKDSLKALLGQRQPDTVRVLRMLDLGYTYIESAPDTMLLLSFQALQLARKVGFERGEALSLTREGNAFYQMGNLSKAMEATIQGLRISEKINDVKGMQKAYNSLGNIHADNGDDRQALAYQLKAKALAEQLKDKRALSIVMSNIGGSYSRLKTYDSAVLFTQQAYDRAAELSSERMMGVPMLVMGTIYQRRGQPLLALEAYRLGASHSTQAGDAYHLLGDYNGMASVFMGQKQYDSSVYYAKLALSLAQQKGFLSAVPTASDLLYNLYKNRGNNDSALLYLEITRKANDSLFTQENVKKLEALNTEEKLRQLEKQQEEARAKEERARNLQYTAIAIGLVTFLILFFLLSHSVMVSQTVIKLLGIVALLVLFEFVNLLIHPYLGEITHHSPFYMLLFMVGLAALLVPLHHRIEHWVVHKMVEKNNRIRLAAAKRTLEKGGRKTSEASAETSTNAQQQL